MGTFSDILFFMEKHGIARDDAASIASQLFQWGVAAAMERWRPSLPAPSDLPQVVEGMTLYENGENVGTVVSPKKRSKPAMVKRRIPNDFALTDDLINFAKERGFAEQRIKKMFEDFTNYYRASGKTWSDWNAVWRTWVNRERDRIAERSGPDSRQGGDSFL